MAGSKKEGDTNPGWRDLLHARLQTDSGRMDGTGLRERPHSNVTPKFFQNLVARRVIQADMSPNFEV